MRDWTECWGRLLTKEGDERLVVVKGALNMRARDADYYVACAMEFAAWATTTVKERGEARRLAEEVARELDQIRRMRVLATGVVPVHV
jgi:acyl-CoA reductase-like NAD-dependent aldehyde dehydrogenase